MSYESPVETSQPITCGAPEHTRTTSLPRPTSCFCISGLTIYVRARPWHETAFAQVLLPVALSYETFVCKLCVALDVDRALVKKVLKIPDILIRTTEDVIRLRADDRLELVLHSSYWKYQAKKKFQAVRPCLTAGLFILLLAMVSAVALHQKEILEQLGTLSQRMDEAPCAVKDSASGHSGMAREESILTQRLKTFETVIIDRLGALEKKFERLAATASDSKGTVNQQSLYHLQTLENVADQFQQLKNLLRRKMKIKEDEL